MTHTQARHDTRDVVELRRYSQLVKTVQQAARAYQRRTDSRINWTDTTPADIAADAYILAQDAPTRPGDGPGDKLRRAAYEAVRRAARAQQRHHHQEVPEDVQTRSDMLEAVAIRQAIQQAGPVARYLAQGLTVSNIAARLGVSRSTAHRLIAAARGKLRRSLDIE